VSLNVKVKAIELTHIITMIRFVSALILRKNPLIILSLRKLLAKAPGGMILFIGDHNYDGVDRDIGQLMKFEWKLIDKIEWSNRCPPKGSGYIKTNVLDQKWQGSFRLISLEGSDC